MKIVVGSRGSKLALIQSNWVVDSLKKEYPDMEFEIKVIKTKGDRIKDVALDKIGDKGLFVREIEKELLDGSIDIAVHSMKDMPSETPENLMFVDIPKREDPRDVLILKEGYNSIEDIPKGGKIGTGSKRRKYQILKHRPDLNVLPIRGNIGTRINKIETENLDGVILAAAGVLRLGWEDRISMYIPPNIILPAPAQGALAIEIRENREDLKEMLNSIKDEKSNIQVKSERAFLKGVNGSCHIPIGAYCIVEGDNITLEGLFGDEDGKCIVRDTIKGKIGEEKELGYKLADKILKEIDKDER
ncbi:hydroxymethylbilane synthase [Dethiothermospora halolimnae]|uniref:hydroxymethylbilane synthase n=1 Tax=Dethiothermospora halolimnae TaxID=3114390 RepID=UPI003CCBF15C